MQPFSSLTAIAAPLPMANVDTDKILAAQFLKTIHRAGLGRALFHTLRQDSGFVLNHAPWNQAGILIAGDNFGCGSSREHAPWALLDFGIRCVIAPSIADIFYNNCFKNGILPVVLPAGDVEALMALASEATTAQMTVELNEQSIHTAAGVFHFSIDPRRKHDLLNGIDEIGTTMTCLTHIDGYEERAHTLRPWDLPISQAAIDAANEIV